jgi:hypothetical protein
MAIIQSAWAKGNRQAVRPQTAGASHTQKFTFDFSSKAVASADILEIGELPPFCQIGAATLVPEGDFTGVTVDVGLMSGAYGDAEDTARTSGNELFAAQAVQFASLSKGEALLIKSVEGSRGIGVKFSGNIGAAAGKKLHLVLFYYQTGE